MDPLNLSIRQGKDIERIKQNIHSLSASQALLKNKQDKTLVHELLVTRNIPFETCKQLIRYLIERYFAVSEEGKKLLSSGDDGGNTIIHYACLNESMDAEFLGELIDACVPGVLEVTNKYKFTPLHLTCSHGNETLVKYLLSRGADKNAQTSFNTDAREIARLNMKDGVVSILDSWK